MVMLPVLVVVVVSAVFLGSRMWHGLYADYSGDGKADVVIQVHDGDSTRAIAQTLVDSHVVASTQKFVDAAHGNSFSRAITRCAPRSRRLMPSTG